MSKNLPAKNRAWKDDSEVERDVVKLIAMDIGKAVADHIESMYPKAVAAVGSSFLLSVRNTTYNEIMAALKTTDEEEIRERLRRRKKERAAMKRIRNIGR